MQKYLFFVPTHLNMVQTKIQLVSGHFIKIMKDTWLKVTVKITPMMHVRKSLQYLKTPIPNFGLRERFASIFHELIKTAFLETSKSCQTQSEKTIFPKYKCSRLNKKLSKGHTMYSNIKYRTLFSLITSLSFTILGWFILRSD